jgi:hypothetical protein
MKVPRRTPNEMALDPRLKESIWNQTTSYISAAAPLPTNRRIRAGRYGAVGVLDKEADGLVAVAIEGLLVGRGIWWPGRGRHSPSVVRRGTYVVMPHSVGKLD